jgi:hypothetical protein
MIAAAAIIAAGVAGRSEPAAAQSADFNGCLAITGEAPTPLCYQAAASSGARSHGSWRLMRALNPHGGPDAISIVHTADVSRSDADLAGLMLRCAHGDIEVLIIVFEPRPPGSRPWVKVSAAGTEAKFEATIALPFTALLLPPDAAALLTGRWRSSDEITVEVQGDPAPVRGIVSLAGLGLALDELRASCSSQ